MKNNQKGFSVVISIILIAVVAIIGLVGWRTYETYNSVNEEADVMRSEVPEGYVKTSIDFTTNGKVISIVHPEGWAIKDETIEGPLGSNLKVKSITSSLNNRIKFSQIDGLGGGCDPDTDEYTLIKKIPTKIENLYFTEYELVDNSKREEYRGVKIEDMSNKSSQHTSLKEGETGTDVCTNLWFYSTYNNVGIDILKENSDKSSKARFSDIEQDAEFIKMLQSFNSK